MWLRVGAALEFETAIDPLSVQWRARAHLSSSLFAFSPLSSLCPVSQYRGDKPSLGPPLLFSYMSADPKHKTVPPSSLASLPLGSASRTASAVAPDTKVDTQSKSDESARVEALAQARLLELLKKAAGGNSDVQMQALSALPSRATGGQKVLPRPSSSGSRGRVFSSLAAGVDASEEDEDPEETEVADLSSALSGVDVSAAAGGGDEGLAPPRPRRSVQCVAKPILAQARMYGSLQSWVRMTEWKSSRNKYECEAIAKAVDHLLAEGLSESSVGL